MKIDYFEGKTPTKHWDSTVNARATWHAYSDVYDDHIFNQLKSNIISHLTTGNRLTYKTHGTSFNFNNKKVHLVSNKPNDRLQEVIYDLTLEHDYWYQTTDTIYDWSWDYLRNNIHPLYLHHLNCFAKEKPLIDEENVWIPFRWHMNVLDFSKFLNLHRDSIPQNFNTPHSSLARCNSLTFYLQDYIPGFGGEFYTLAGDIYEPKKNSAILINGGKSVHGVNSNMNPDKKLRLAFTVRWAHKDDLYLPGHPDKSLYHREFF